MTISKPKWFVVWDQLTGEGDDDMGYFQSWETRWKAFNFKTDGKKRAEQALERLMDQIDLEITKKPRVIHGLTIDGQLNELHHV